MNLCRCEKGHFFDREKYAVCPYCADGREGDTKKTVSFEGEDTISNGSSPVETPNGGGMAKGDQRMDRMENQGYSTPPVIPNMPPIPEMPADQVTVPDNEGMDRMNQADNVNVYGGTGDADDHTIGFFDDAFSQATGETTADSRKFAQRPVSKPAMHTQAPNIVTTPCVGWLVALGGTHIGVSFTLKAGKNFIGRESDMDVALTEEKSVSRNRHAIVIYEPRESIFLVQSGDSSSLTYHNNKVVLMPMQLEAYDTITVGNVNLLFMPLCGKRFQWGELLEAMKKKNNG